MMHIIENIHHGKEPPKKLPPSIESEFNKIYVDDGRLMSTSSLHHSKQFASMPNISDSAGNIDDRAFVQKTPAPDKISVSSFSNERPSNIGASTSSEFARRQNNEIRNSSPEFAQISDSERELISSLEKQLKQKELDYLEIEKAISDANERNTKKEKCLAILQRRNRVLGECIHEATTLLN